MPGGDGTGPRGYGPLTGRGLGPCGRGLAFRRGFGRGFGRIFRRGFWNRARPIEPYQPQQLTKEQEKQYLEEDLKSIDEEKKLLENEKESIKKRLEELNK